jgi:hypothetical protein
MAVVVVSAACPDIRYRGECADFEPSDFAARQIPKAFGDGSRLDATANQDPVWGRLWRGPAKH